MIDLDQIKNIHFIGIGGAGMSALANVLIKRGFHVSGSDAKPGDMATKLAKEGALVFIGMLPVRLSEPRSLSFQRPSIQTIQSWWKLTSAVFLSFIAVTSWLIS